jgi:uncharacterized BrkB/YihY/UPF0761 family membrane protein
MEAHTLRVSSPAQLPKRSSAGVLRRTATGFRRHNLPDWAAALTCYSILGIFPALLTNVMVLLGAEFNAVLERGRDVEARDLAD